MNEKALNPLIDGDILVYRCGFAAKEDEPLEYTLHTVKSVLEFIYDKFPERKWSKLYLTGKDNFRDTLATLQVYKGNRDPSHKPQYYQEIKDYLINVHGAETIIGQEADDAQGIEQWSHKDKSTVIVGIDKDLKMIPGYHYNWVKDILEYQNLRDANEFFFFQMLTGDRTDNIPGIKGVGDKTAAKLLAPAVKNITAMQKVVMDQYIKQYGEEVAPMAYREVANLLWIRREENQECPF